MRRASLDEVVAEWLRAEIASSRFGSRLEALLARDGRKRDLLEHPVLDDPEANAYRRRLLGEFRGFGLPTQPEPSYIGGFPVTEIAWWWAVVARDELPSIHFINWDYWVEVTDGTRLPATLVKRLNEAPNRQPGLPDTVLATLQTGAAIPPLILVDSGPDTRVVVLEGHVRLLAYVLGGDSVPERLDVILGRSPLVAAWDMY
ncbi:MAG: hypothetical protein ACRDI2_17245 [Chloroflexota bacterium]